METENLTSLNIFCTTHKVETSFIYSLQQNGLIEITTIHEIEYIDTEQLKQLEKIVQFYYELDINLEGIETIIHLLERVNYLQDEIIALRNKLRIYEKND